MTTHALTRALAALAAAVLIAGVRPMASPGAESAAGDLLDRYNQGAQAAVVAELASRRDVLAIRDDFERTASAWAEQPGVPDIRRRRLVAATFGLEVARVHLETTWRALRGLVETGCEIVRRNPAGPNERLWQLASVALAEGAMDAPLLGDGQHHLAHAAQSFPDEPRFRLAKTVMDEVFIDREPRGEDAYPIAASTRARQSIVAESYRALFDVPGIGAEAHLRAGYLRFQRAAPADALAEFSKAADASDDPFVSYLAQFLAGRTLAAIGREAEADAAFRYALRIVPDAQSASELLATRLFAAGRPIDAYALVERSLAAQPIDPWRFYGYGDFRRWPDLIGRLRETVKPQ